LSYVSKIEKRNAGKFLLVPKLREKQIIVEEKKKTKLRMNKQENVAGSFNGMRTSWENSVKIGEDAERFYKEPKTFPQDILLILNLPSLSLGFSSAPSSALTPSF
jgi:hypothetical protein